MATWNVGQYDAAMNDAQRILDNQYRRQQAEFDQDYKRSEQQRLIDNEMNRRKVAAEQLKYDRDRQAVSDKRAALDYEFKKRAKKRAEELAAAQHENNKKILAKKQELASATLQNQINAQNDIISERAYLNRDKRDHATEAYHKILAGVPLTPEEKAILEERHPLRFNTFDDVVFDENSDMLPIEEYILKSYKNDPSQEDFKKVNPQQLKFYRNEHKITAEQKKQDEYKRVKAEMTGLYRKYRNDDFNQKEMDAVVESATNIFKNNKISMDEAMKRALGQSSPNEYTTPEEFFFRRHGTKYTDLPEDKKQKLKHAFNKYNEMRVRSYSTFAKDDLLKEYNALLELEKFWQTAMDKAEIKGITSPFYQRLMQLNNEDVL